MGKAIGGVPEATPVGGAPVPDRSIGRYLAQQRELRGIGREELARITRIPLRSLERLESGVFDEQPDGFVRGFVRTVAIAIGLDPDETIARMLAEPEASAGPGHPNLRRVAVALAALLLLVGMGAALARLGGSEAPAPAPPTRDPLPLRRDPVRDLARAQGLLPDQAPPQAPIAPEPEPTP